MFRLSRIGRGSERGQMLLMTAVSMVAIIGMVGLVIDGSFAWSQRRAVQNGADMAAMAGARVVGMYMSGPIPAGADANVESAIQSTLTSNGLSTTKCGGAVTVNCYTAVYTDSAGTPVGTSVGSGTLPSTARGVRVTPNREFGTFFVQVLGFDSANTDAPATARAAGFAGTVGGPGGALLPIAVTVNESLWDTNFCPPDRTAAQCTSISLNEAAEGSGHNGLPGQFNWMSWNGTGNTGYLCSVLGPPASSPSYTVPENSAIVIAGNSGVSNGSCVRNGINAWVAAGTTVIVPIISRGPPTAGNSCVTQPDRCYANGTPHPAPGQGNGSSATYNVIGFAGFQLTGCGNPCIDEIRGVFRQAMFAGPTDGSPGTPSVPGEALTTQLIQ